MRIELTVRRFTLMVIPEQSRWAQYCDGQYGMAVTYWHRPCNAAKWHWGVRFSLLLGHRRPFIRVTTYSCPLAGSADTVQTLDCVIQKKRR